MTASKLYGQFEKCDTIFNYAEVMPKYINDLKGLSDYFLKELVPIIEGCIKRDKEIIESLQIKLTIDVNGKVIDAIFPKNNLNSQCKEELKKKLLTMTGWTPGRKDGRPVCCNFIWPINCIKWE